MTGNPVKARRLADTGKLLGLLFSGGGRRDPAKVYDFLSTHNHLAESSLYLNLGYWKNAGTYDAACEALAELLGEQAGLTRGDVVIDCGCGFGDQDSYWLRRFSPAHITGVNITKSQVSVAARRFPDPALTFITADAARLPCADQSCDKVLALESAFHFDPREAFFREARRVLKPGGRLALADVLVSRDPQSHVANLIAKMGRSLWQTPECNAYGADTYAAKLEQSGFRDVKITLITEHVFAPFKAYARRRVQDAEIRARVHPLLRRIWASGHGGFDGLDYAIITATRG